jgi:hypothetical protein
MKILYNNKKMRQQVDIKFKKILLVIKINGLKKLEKLMKDVNN